MIYTHDITFILPENIWNTWLTRQKNLDLIFWFIGIGFGTQTNKYCVFLDTIAYGIIEKICDLLELGLTMIETTRMHHLITIRQI